MNIDNYLSAITMIVLIVESLLNKNREPAKSLCQPTPHSVLTSVVVDDMEDFMI